MATLKKYNIDGKAIGQVQVDEALVNAEANSQMIKDYIVAIRANARQWSANTKGRSEVNHTTKKPHPQKGQGRSRQGSLAAPQYKGGGRVFGPKPKFDQHVRINKKERKAAIRFLISEKIKEDRILVIDDTKMNAPKTKAVADFLEKVGCQKRVLFLVEGNVAEFDTADGKQRVDVKCLKHGNFAKSLRNIPFVELSLAKNISGYDVMIAQNIIITEAGLKELNEWLC